MSRSQTFSVAWFGKKRPFEPGIVQEYSLQGVSEDFPSDALQKFQRVVRRFRWDPCPTSEGGSSSPRFEPCVGIWSLPENRWLLVRFTDDGQDDRQRPHLLGAAAIVFDAAASKDPEADLLGIATAAHWPDPQAGCEGAAPPIHLTWNTPESAMLSQWRQTAANTERPPVIFCSTQNAFHYDADPSERVFVLSRDNGAIRQVSQRPPDISLDPPATAPDSSRSLPWLTIVAFVGMALTIGGSIYLARENSQLTTRLDELERSLFEMKSDLESTKEQLDESTEAIETKDDAIKELRVANDKLRKQNLSQRQGLTDDEKQMLHRSSLVESKLDDLRRYHNLVAEILNICRPSVDDSP